MSLRLNGSTSGYSEIDAPAIAGNNTLVLPTGNGSADQALVTNGSGTLSFADRGRMVLETDQSATGTEVDFTSIPSWVKRVTVMFEGVTTNGITSVLLQLGDSGGIESSGYLGSVNDGDSAAQNAQFSNGFKDNTANASIVRHGQYTLSNITGNTWACVFQLGFSNSAAVRQGAGSVTLSDTLDRIRITTGNGTDTFDAGTINLLLEG
jgi:hypothetical protein